jgi:hypothetical protein
MANQVGLRVVDVLEGVTKGNYGRNIPVLLEVTNEGAATTKFYANDNPKEGHRAQGIPIAAGATRQIPLQVYWFTADSAVTVVAYKP